jgi:hypothetical protein
MAAAAVVVNNGPTNAASRNIIKKSNVLDEIEFKKLKDYVRTLEFNEPSNVFKIQSKQNVHNTNLRKSFKLVDKTPDILVIVDKLICNMDGFKIERSRDHVTFIKYETGGFFKEHVDFEKYRINNSIEMHLIFCIEAPKSGGELKIKIDNVYEMIDNVRVENSCVVFNKKYPHSSEIVTDGEKIIMTVDVLVHVPQDYTIKGADIDEFDDNKNQIIITQNSEEFEYYLKKNQSSLDIVPFVMLKATSDYNNSAKNMCNIFDVNDTYETHRLNNALCNTLDGGDGLSYISHKLESNFSKYIMLLEKYSTKTLSRVQKKKITEQLSNRLLDVDPNNNEEVNASEWCNEEYAYYYYHVSIFGGFAHKTADVNAGDTSACSDGNYYEDQE